MEFTWCPTGRNYKRASKLTEAQIVYSVDADRDWHPSGRPVPEVWRQEARLVPMKAEVRLTESERAASVEGLENEDVELARLMAGLSLDGQVLKGAIGNNR